jgi:hypothetical protein
MLCSNGTCALVAVTVVQIAEFAAAIASVKYVSCHSNNLLKVRKEYGLSENGGLAHLNSPLSMIYA